MKNKILEIKNLSVSFSNKKIIENLNLNINLGETHVIMGPNGAGKSTLANILSGNNKNYKIEGFINFINNNLMELSAEELSLMGIFLSFQHPIEIPGLSNLNFFKAIINSKRKYNGLDPINNNEFNSIVNKYSDKLKIKKDLLNRSVNDGFSGGEKKRNEILQMFILNPKLVILDEIDSGLDIDSLKLVFDALNEFKNKNNSLIIITHYSRILNYINIDYAHVLKKGKIIESGDKNLIYKIEKDGYYKNEDSINE